MWLMDRLSNFVSGLGTAKDKSDAAVFGFHPLTDVQLNAMHRSDWLARKIVDIIPNDMTREWREWQAEGDAIEAIEAVEKSPLINLQIKANEALKKARLLGGAGIYIGMRDGASDQPLELDRIGKGDLLYLHVLTRLQVSVGEIDRDVTSEFFGQPAYYELNGTGQPVRVHPSRFVRFIGAEVLDEQALAYTGWGDSVLQVVYDAVRNAASAQGHVASLIPEAKSDVIYVPRLSEFLKDASTTQKLTERFSYANTMKSMFNMILLEGDGDNGERWEQKQINFAQLPELMRQFLQIASGAADIPVTRLLGESPAGLNATGQSDLQNYYDNIAARQKMELAPALHRLDEIIIRSATGTRNPSDYFAWAPLWGLSDTEKATILKTKADAARALAGGNGQQPIIPIEALSDAVVNALIEDGSLPGLEAAIEEYGSLAEQEDDTVEAEAAVTPTASKTEVVGDAAPRTLYVSRTLLNAADVTAWAKSQGFETTLPASDMHVTITYSREPVDWMKMGSAWPGDDKNGELTVPPGGARLVEQLGGGAVVLAFASSVLSWRHEDMVQNGASWDWLEYQPHVTITYEPGEVDLSNVEPYRGELRFGPEIFEEVNEDWKAGVKEI